MIHRVHRVRYFSAVVLGGSLRGLWSGPDSELCEADCKHESDGMDRLNYRCNPAPGSMDAVYADPSHALYRRFTFTQGSPRASSDSPTACSTVAASSAPPRHRDFRRRAPPRSFDGARRDNTARCEERGVGTDQKCADKALPCPCAMTEHQRRCRVRQVVLAVGIASSQGPRCMRRAW